MHDHDNCRHLLDSLSEFVDGDLDAEICNEIERHISGCEDCQIVVDTLRKTIFLYHTTTESSHIPSDVRTRLYRRLDLDEFLDKPLGASNHV
jgi:anti-sigma factor (TIGR02949 family)